MRDDYIFELLHVGDVEALVGHRIYRHGTAPLNVVAPYLTWFVVDGLPENVLDGPPPVDRIEVQVDCWSDNTGTGARLIGPLMRAVRTQVETAHHVTSYLNDQQDNATQRYRATLTFTVWGSDEDP